jgi:hypothetical protein
VDGPPLPVRLDKQPIVTGGTFCLGAGKALSVAMVNLAQFRFFYHKAGEIARAGFIRQA